MTTPNDPGPDTTAQRTASLIVDAVLADYVSDKNDNGTYTLELGENETTKLREDLIRAITKHAPTVPPTPDGGALREKAVAYLERWFAGETKAIARWEEAGGTDDPAKIHAGAIRIVLDALAATPAATGDKERIAELERELDKARIEVEATQNEADMLIKERDEAEEAADKLASGVLGEPIDWSDHQAKWEEALDALAATPAATPGGGPSIRQTFRAALQDKDAAKAAQEQVARMQAERNPSGTIKGAWTDGASFPATPPATTGTPAGAEAALALKEGAEWALTALRRDLQSARDFDGYYGPHRKAVALLVAAGVHAKPETYTGL